MWKKDEEQGDKAPVATKAKAADTKAGAQSTGTASIGKSITIHGEVSGDEDLLIQGRVEGSVDLKEHAVTVGSAGHVTASIHARVVTVEGTVKGDIQALEQIILKGSADVEGDLTAPRVVLQDGARFRGGVDMGENNSSRSSSPSSTSRSRGSSSTGSASTSARTSDSASKATQDKEAVASAKAGG